MVFLDPNSVAPSFWFASFHNLPLFAKEGTTIRWYYFHLGSRLPHLEDEVKMVEITQQFKNVWILLSLARIDVHVSCSRQLAALSNFSTIHAKAEGRSPRGSPRRSPLNSVEILWTWSNNSSLLDVDPPEISRGYWLAWLSSTGFLILYLPQPSCPAYKIGAHTLRLP